MAVRNFGDVVDQLGHAASVALLDRDGAGRDWVRAAATGNVRYYAQPGARIDADGQIAVGTNLQGRVRNSLVVSLSGGCLDATDSVVVGNSVRVLARGRTHVQGVNARVRICNRKAAVVVQRIDVDKRKRGLHFKRGRAVIAAKTRCSGDRRRRALR